MEFQTLKVSVSNHIAHIELNRPDKANAMDMVMWREIGKAFDWADGEADVRVVVLSGNGKHFTAGIDLMALMGVKEMIKDECEGRSREKLRRLILQMQDDLSALERCRKPVLAAIHNGCIGGGVDLVCCADMRYASADAYFCVKEIDIGMVADVGTLQRLPKLIGEGLARELAFTGRKLNAEEAKQIGYVNCVFADRDALLAGVMEIAAEIASKSPLSIRGTKEMLNYTRDHSVADGLNFIATWNAGMLLSNDIQAAVMASMSKSTPSFKN